MSGGVFDRKHLIAIRQFQRASGRARDHFYELYRKYGGGLWPAMLDRLPRI